ncbi:MAG: NAD(P)H-dependent oxidoreductase [Ethanoligenens sp.]
MATMNEKFKIGIILGSNRPGRICQTMGEWVLKTMCHESLAIDLIDLADIDLPFLDEPEIPAHHHYHNEPTLVWSKLISGYDGFVLLFPQYNWGYPAVLKNALDYLFDEWAGKPVSTICYGSHGGFQASIAMKLVTQGLNMHNMATNPSFDISREMFDEHGQFLNIDSAFACYRKSLQAVSSEFVDLLEK